MVNSEIYIHTHAHTLVFQSRKISHCHRQVMAAHLPPFRFCVIFTSFTLIWCLLHTKKFFVNFPILPLGMKQQHGHNQHQFTSVQSESGTYTTTAVWMAHWLIRLHSPERSYSWNYAFCHCFLLLLLLLFYFSLAISLKRHLHRQIIQNAIYILSHQWKHVIHG